MTKKTSFMIVVLLIPFSTHYACTVFSASRNGLVLAAKNQDYHIIDTRMYVQPAEERLYGVIHFGDKNEAGFCNTSGMNDQGLWYAGASVPERTDIRNIHNKPVYQGELIEGVMEQCATVDEAIAMFSRYYTPHWSGHFLLTDGNGASVIVEFGEDDVVFIKPENEYHVATNFYNGDQQNKRWSNCYRYKVADYMLKTCSTITVDLFRDICDATHAEGPGPTVLSTVHDLRSGDIYIYDFHNYNEVVTVNGFDLIREGERYSRIRDYFHQITLTTPREKSRVNPDNVQFEWTGNSNDFYLYFSTDPDFHKAVPIHLGSEADSHPGFASIFFFTSLPLFGLTIIRKKYLPALFLLVVLGTVHLSCELEILEPPEPSKLRHSYMISDLESNTRYYWKIVVPCDADMSNESVVRSFTTMK